MKKFIPFIICFALLLSISFSSTVFAATNETEPNDTMANANAISSGSTISGKISTYSDVDFYKLSIMYSGTRIITLSNIPSGCNYDLYLYDTKGNLISYSGASDNKDGSITKSMQVQEQYYICVKSSSGYSGSSDYTLSVKASDSVTTPVLPYHGGDAYEYNDKIELASNFYGSLEANIHPLGDADWYRFSVTQTSAKHFRLYSPSYLTYHFAIYNANGGYVCSDGGIGDYTVTLSPGTYYVKVFSYDSESVLNYSLQMTTV